MGDDCTAARVGSRRLVFPPPPLLSSSREQAPLEVCPCEKTVQGPRVPRGRVLLSAFINKSNFHDAGRRPFSSTRLPLGIVEDEMAGRSREKSPGMRPPRRAKRTIDDSRWLIVSRMLAVAIVESFSLSVVVVIVVVQLPDFSGKRFIVLSQRRASKFQFHVSNVETVSWERRSFEKFVSVVVEYNSWK